MPQDRDQFYFNKSHSKRTTQKFYSFFQDLRTQIQEYELLEATPSYQFLHSYDNAPIPVRMELLVSLREVSMSENNKYKIIMRKK